MNIYKRFGTDKKSEEEGVVLNFGDGLKVIVKRAGSGNREFKKAIMALERKFKTIGKGNLLSEEEEKEYNDGMIDALCKHVIVSWTGVIGQDGKEIPFSIANGVKVLTDLPEFFLEVLEQARNAENFRNEEAEEAVKN